MGGNLLIKSAEDKGSEIILTIDQKVVDPKANKTAYDDFVNSSLGVAIVNQTKKRNESMKRYFNDNDIKTTIYLNGHNLIDDIKAGKKYKYIIVADSMKSINGYTIFQKLHELEDFKIPMIIIADDEEMNKHFIEEGFSFVINEDTFKEDIDAVISKFQ